MSQPSEPPTTGTEQVLEVFGEKLVECPNPDCDGDELVDAQKIIARPGGRGRGTAERTPCCRKTRDELFEIVPPADADDEEEDREPMEDAYAFEAEVSS